MKAYLGSNKPTFDEYALDTEAPYTYIQLRRIFGSWDRFLNLIDLTEEPIKKVIAEKSPSTKEIK